MICLRDVTEADSARLLGWRNMPEVARYMYSDHTIGQAEHDAWFEGMMADPARQYWIIESDGRAVGMACLYPVEKAAGPETHWAFYIAEPSERGKGIGAAVEFLVLRHVFEELGLERLHCEVFAFNEAVIRLHRKVGFRDTAHIENHSRKNGEWQAVVALAFDAADWPAARVRLEPLARRAGAL